MTFKKEIELDNVKSVFHFHRVKRAFGDFFLVSFVEPSHAPHAFIMAQNDSGFWEILPQSLPAWTQQAQAQLNNCIGEHVDNNAYLDAAFNPWNLTGGTDIT